MVQIPVLIAHSYNCNERKRPGYKRFLCTLKKEVIPLLVWCTHSVKCVLQDKIVVQAIKYFAPIFDVKTKSLHHN
jgi:hypothetical protein